MRIDCDQCVGQGTDLCEDCVVTFILREGDLELDPDEEQALEALSEAGLLPRLRLVPIRRPPLTEAG